MMPPTRPASASSCSRRATLFPVRLCANKTSIRTPTSSCKLGTWRMPFAMLAPTVGVRILFGERLEADNALVIDTSAAFGWSGSPASYDVVGGAIAYLHGRSVNVARDAGTFNYVWVDDHTNVAANIGSNCADVEQSLRLAMATVLGPDAINEDKFTSWARRQQIIGLIFDTVTNTVVMPASKIAMALECVPPSSALATRSGFLRDETRSRVVVSYLGSSVPERHSAVLFPRTGSPDTVVEMDVSDDGLCALVAAGRQVLRYRFALTERHLIQTTKTVPMTGFDINYRELLSCAFTVHTWGSAWTSHQGDPLATPVHVQFRIDNTSAVSWQTKMGSRNTRAQTVIRLRSHWELAFGLHFSSIHVPGAENRIADAGSRSFCKLGVGSPFPGSNKWLAAGSTVGGRHTAGADIAYYLRAHSVAESTYTNLRSPQISIAYGSGRRVRASSIVSVLHGTAHFFQAVALPLPCNHPQIRMVLQGISRLDSPSRHKAPVSHQLLETCYQSLDLPKPSDQALWGVLCLAFFFLMRQSKIAAKGTKFSWFAMKMSNIAVTDGTITREAQFATTVHIQLMGSNTNQYAPPHTHNDC
ncbi:unnamed protein product [Phytophthora fragariaefolia]|uniref:Unnamed protein product n=1 Tax=Phytophthora fragariaefolia TaxID=1490495 RepID=A0A9W6TPQ9_9STRA|nr:unnamed protein product [Phytophthora fragariaefolia]